ncbi:MAG TPA: site-specific DNA-methyltransferase [Terriglobales bacterium]|nr:site-specific DNA-methyltransferase [Terriglobales bacterium]
MPRRPAGSKSSKTAKAYDHKESEAVLRPEIGIQAQFKKKKDPAKYRYDRSLDPQLSWDINADREHAEALIEKVRSAKSLEEARAAADELKRMSSPFLNWAGKAERNSFSVPTLPLFVHERLSTEAILKSVQTHKQQLDLFADPKLDLAERVLRAYEHKTGWVNRLILGDSLVVMNSLLKYEGLGGQVQCIYVDPPYGVKFGSNFQPFIRKRDVKHNDDADLTREPEMVQAYRDTWELGLHSYLTYLRDRFLLCRELLHPSGSIFVQISDENLHHVRELLDEVFGADNYCGTIAFATSSNLTSDLIATTNDYLLWYARDKVSVKYHQLYLTKETGQVGGTKYTYVELRDGTRRALSQDEQANPAILPEGSRLFTLNDLTSSHEYSLGSQPFKFEGREFVPRRRFWTTSPQGMQRLADAKRLFVQGNTLRYIRFIDDFPLYPVTDNWPDIGGVQSRTDPKVYVVQTSTTAVRRCILMTTDPGDLVLDPTCGSGTTAYVAEQWGRRWITIDTSRVPLALARQRLLTATFPYYELHDDKAGPAGGFVYRRRQNARGEEVGGIVPHITLKSIANNEPPEEEVLVDRPEVVKGVTRVTGPFVVEATIPTPANAVAGGDDPGGPASTRPATTTGGPASTRPATTTPEEFQSHIERMLEALRRSPVLRLPGNQTVTFKNVRQPAKTLSLNAEAEIEENPKSEIRNPKLVAFVFGPENGAVSEQLVFQAAKEAYAKSYEHLYVIGFAIEDAATKLIQTCEAVVGIPATYVAATMDLQMHDLLKTTRASQIFSVTGAPEIKLTKLPKKSKDGDELYQVELLGLDVFDPVTMETTHRKGDDVPAWFLDTDYNELAFCVAQAFFPRTAAWENLKRELRGVYADSVWEHLAGTTSEAFVAGEHKQIAVKVIDDRGNELLVVKKLSEAEEE